MQKQNQSRVFFFYKNSDRGLDEIVIFKCCFQHLVDLILIVSNPLPKHSTITSHFVPPYFFSQFPTFSKFEKGHWQFECRNTCLLFHKKKSSVRNGILLGNSKSLWTAVKLAKDIGAELYHEQVYVCPIFTFKPLACNYFLCSEHYMVC